MPFCLFCLPHSRGSVCAGGGIFLPGRQNFCLFCLFPPFFFVLLPSTCGRWFGHNIFFHQPTAMSFEPPHPAFEPEPEPPCPSSHPPLQRTFSQANSVASADMADDLFQFPMEGLELPCTPLVSVSSFFLQLPEHPSLSPQPPTHAPLSAAHILICCMLYPHSPCRASGWCRRPSLRTRSRPPWRPRW